jgi:hypothetical protein
VTGPTSVAVGEPHPNENENENENAAGAPAFGRHFGCIYLRLANDFLFERLIGSPSRHLLGA